jgi:uncharacterized protein with PIN domain
MKKRTNVEAIAAAIQRGFPVEHAHVFGDVDAALEGHDAHVALPVLINVIDSIASRLAPAAQEQVATLMSEAAFQIAERAREQSQPAAEAAQPTGDNHGNQPEEDQQP